MSDRSKAQREAERRYEAKRQKAAIKIRLDDNDMNRLDNARGEKSRAAYVEEATMEKLKKDKA
ncbi:MAG: hypothetical protein AAF950_07115 [Pseudomonadota bacterium]